MLPQLSIIISTYRREKLLKLTLDSLLEQTSPFSQFEVIVVDNDAQPHPPTQTLCAAPDYRSLTLKLVHQPLSGVSEARNYGVRHSTAPLVGFVDDDERLAPYWVERALEISATRTPDIFGGPYHPFYNVSKPNWFKDQYVVMSHGTSKLWLKEGMYLFGGNLIFQRAWLDRLKGFSAELGHKGTGKESGEEIEIQLRANRLGARIFYDPDLYILHYVLPERLTPAWYLQSAWYTGKARAKIAALNPHAHLPLRAPEAGSGTRSGSAAGRVSFFVRLKNMLRDSMRLLGRYLGLPFRSRKVFPFSPNYLIERVAPAIRDFSASWFSLVYPQKSGH